MPNHPITPLASAQINHDTIAIELIEPNGLPPMGKNQLASRADGGRPETFPRRCSGDRATVCSSTHCARCNPGGAATLIARADRAFHDFVPLTKNDTDVASPGATCSDQTTGRALN
jgi:hypothetical protein